MLLRELLQPQRKPQRKPMPDEEYINTEGEDVTAATPLLLAEGQERDSADD